MISLLRLLAAAAAAFLIASNLGGPYWLVVVLTFLVAGIAAAFVRTPFTPMPRSVSDLVPDLIVPLLLSGVMLLAVRAFAPGDTPTPIIPALVWPLVDLWRPLGRRGSR